jgi:hypothetical protein
MKKITLILGIIVMCMMLKAESCTQKVVKAATNDGQKALVENTTKIPVVFSHFMNIGDSTTITGIIDFKDAGMGDVLHIDTMTTNVAFRFDIPIKASFPITLNLPQSWGIALIVGIVYLYLPSTLMVIGGFIWFIVWLRRKK